MATKALSITQFNAYIKQIFDNEELLCNAKVYGEISGFSITRGVAYFSLKDENACLPCVMFGAISKCAGLKDGDLVVATGSPNYYTKAGRFNFNCHLIEPYGQGDLYKNFMLLKKKLEDEGLFDLARKKQIASVKKIGVVSSQTGAVIQDIINVSTRRNKAINIVLYPAKVQGIGAEHEIAKGVEFFSNYDVDVVVVARGGGSLEDLQPFNTEVVARAVANCKKPVVSAVGLETDFTICDFVADLRAPTPSAAAELIVEDISRRGMLLDSLASRLLRLLNSFETNQEQFIKLRQQKIAAACKTYLSKCESVLGVRLTKLYNVGEHMLEERYYIMNMQNTKLAKLSPYQILSLGYSKIEKDKKVVSSICDVQIGNELDVRLSDGLLKCRCTAKEEL